MYKLSRFLVDLGDEGDSNESTLFSTRTGGAIKISKQEYEALREGVGGAAIDSARMKELENAGIVFLEDGKNELQFVIDENLESINTSREIYLPILTSTACQLGCTYCGQAHAKGEFSEADTTSLLQHISKRISRPEIESLRIGLFGGEPLLALKWIFKFFERVEMLPEMDGVKLASKLVTNGISATYENVAALVARAGLDTIEITLDGPKASHNAQRGSKNGRDYYSKILANITGLKSIANLRKIIRCNVTRSSSELIPEFIAEITGLGFADYCEIYFAPVHSWGNSANQMALNAEEYAYRELLWKISLIQKGWKIGLLPARKKITCLAVRKDGAVIAPSGEIYECTEMPIVPRYKTCAIATLAPSNEFSNNQRQFANFNENISLGKLPCSTCFALPVCGGACPKEWAEGRHPCPSFKYVAREAIIASGLI